MTSEQARALKTLASMTVDQLTSAFASDGNAELRKDAEALVVRLQLAITAGNIDARKHTFEPSDISPNVCCKCGKAKQYKGTGH